jgi:glyoxylase-like metal-dependent hydrolase (beta-lactamase superfamily II)
MPYVGQVWDLFADGSVWLIPIAGHSRGQLAALLNTSEGPLLFTFDASHLRSNLEHRVIPGSTVDEAQALDAIDRLRALQAAYPALRVFYGHEPTQWEQGREEVVLAQTWPEHGMAAQ